MSYTPTVFVEGSAPAINAVELNKLGTGTATAATAADDALGQAFTAEVGAGSATSAFIGAASRVRTTDTPIIAGPALVPVLTMTVPDASGRTFLVNAMVLYVADATVGGQVALAVDNGLPARQAVTDGGIAAYTYASTALGTLAHPTLLVWDNTSSPVAFLDGADDDVQAATLSAVVINGDATADVTISLVAAEGESPGAAPLRILSGSYLTIEYVS